MDIINKFILGMAMLRFMSGSIEIFAGIIMLRLNEIQKALIVNTTLALVGPVILILTTSLGLIGISDKISFVKLAWIITGILFILIGIRK